MTTKHHKMKAQFELERQLRRRILMTPREQRPQVVSQAYAELFDRFPNHQAFEVSNAERKSVGRRKAAMILPLAKAGDRVLEVGIAWSGREASSWWKHLIGARGRRIFQEDFPKSRKGFT